MTAVSQSYPNYLGGLNEQPDELKKPGQLVEALNVIPDPVLGLTRRPGFELVPITESTDEDFPTEVSKIKPKGTWFEIEQSNQYNDDYIYFGNVSPTGKVNIINQDGEMQRVLYSDQPVVPHKTYEVNYNYTTVQEPVDPNFPDGPLLPPVQKLDDIDFITYDNNNNEIYRDVIPAANPYTVQGYLSHDPENPLKYCITKKHVIISNPVKVPRLNAPFVPTDDDRKRYYSFISLKLVDTANYNYIFKRFYADGSQGNETVQYRTIQDISIDDVSDVVENDYDRDLSLPLQTEGPFEFDLQPNDSGITEPARVSVTFTGRVVQLKSSDGDGYRNEARYTETVSLISPGKGFKNGTIRETIDGVNGLPDIPITFSIETGKVTSTRNTDIVPEVTDDDNADAILRKLADKFVEAGIDKVLIVGNGLYLENNQEFSISTSEPAVADVINSQKLDDDLVPIARVNTVAELPIECYNGFQVQVVNSLDGKNDYYLEYKSESQSTIEDTDDPLLTKADGFWEEIAKPFEPNNPQNVTLPHAITIVKETDRPEFVFVVSPVRYVRRTAGTSKDNPSMFEDSATITEVNYYKNRLFFFTDIGTIISSRAGEINNLFINTAINTSLIDPVDIVANSNQKVPIYGSAVVNNGMVLFGSSEQYSMTTQGDVFSSETVSVTKVSNYTYCPGSKPIYLGTNIGFVSDGLTRFYEMTNVYDRGPVDINERSQQVQSRFGRRFDMPVSSREQSQVAFYKRYVGSGENESARNLMLYRFRQENSQESSQTSWVRWQLPPGNLITYMSMPKDKMFVIVYDPSTIRCSLWRMDSGSLDGAPIRNELDVTRVPVYLDGWYEDQTGEVQGGKFNTVIQFPTIYPRAKEGSDVTSNVTIHRVKMSTALIGTYNLQIDRYGYDPYNILVEQTPADSFPSSPVVVRQQSIDIPPLRDEHIEVVPIYTRNKNLTLTMYTDANAPLALRSMTWEGDYNQPYYKRA